MTNTTKDKFGKTVNVGDIVKYKLSDSAFDRQGPVTEIRESGSMYVRNPRTGYVDLMYSSHVTKVN